jgi:hypothetical protein
MRKTAILVIANLLWFVPTAQANEVARIQSAPGQSQAAWNATAEYQAFQCPAGTARGEGVDMNFTTTRSDDYHFAYCVEIIQPAPRPTLTMEPAPTPTSDTATATTVTLSPTPTPITPSSEPAASNSTSTSAVTETSTATSSATPGATATAAFDYQAFLQMFIAWFQSWFAQFLSSWSVINR